MTSQFSSQLPTLQIAWDQTSMSEFQVCPRKYYYTIISGYVPAKEPLEFFFGRVYHSALEEFDKALANGYPFDTAQDVALQLALRETHGWQSEDRIRNRENLIRTVVWYTERYKTDAIRTAMIDGKPAVELTFALEFPMTAATGDQYLLTGHLDGIAEVPGYGQVVRERKTTKSTLGDHYFEGFNPGLQITWYAYGAQIVLREPASHVMLDAAQIGVGFSAFGRTFLARNRNYYFTEFIKDIKDNLGRAESYAEADYWPKNERNCWICPFREVCHKPPDLRQNALDSDYAKRTWNPLDVRG